MKKKVFSLMMMLLLAFMGVAKADVVTVGSGTESLMYVPSYSYYKNDISQQIYTAAEIGYTGTINSIAFYNDGAEKTRTWDVYMVKTTKTAFDSQTDWITATSSDLVFSGSVTMTADAWTALTLSTPFDFDGTTNLAIIVDDNTGSYLPSPHMECRVFSGGDNCAIYTYSDYTDFDPLASISATGTCIAKKNQIQLDMNVTGTVGPGSVTFDDKLHVKYMDGTTEVIDSLNLGVRPIGAWMAPFEFVMYSEGPTYTVNVLDFTPSDGIFSIVDAELPFEVAPSADVDLLMSTDGTQAGVIERQFVAIAEERAAHIWPVVVEFYEPEIPDVVEKPCVDAVNFPFVEWPATDHGTTLHNDYTLPFPEIPEGFDAVYKLVFDHDVMLNAEVTTGADGKVALYRENFEGEGGPMADNYYQGPIGGAGGSGGSSAGFEAMIGDETSTTTTTYFPFHTLWKYSLSENLFLASELSAAGVTTSPMTSLSWYVSSMTCTTPQNGISIWMANVSDTELTGTSHLTSGMTLVYTGTNVLPVAGQWNEFEFNGGNFAWDGHSNVLVVCQRQNGAWEGSISWQTHNPGFAAMNYTYTDTDPGFDATTTTYTMSTSTINRANIIMKAATGGSKGLRAGTMSYGPVITDAAVAKGTYYLVASSTDPDFEVTINAETMPCPGVEGFAFGPTPADDADGIEPGSVTLRWNIPAYATGWRLVFGSTYYPDPSHPQTIMYPEDGSFSNELANSFTVRDLWNNTNYFWHVEFNNDGCPNGVSSPIWGFTTHLNIPQNLTVEDETVFNDEQIVLHWNPVVDRTYRMYYIYRDGVKVGETETNNINATSYTDGPLAYNMSGYTYYVTAVYDEGESAPSDPVTVKVSGYGDVDGHVYEQDGTTGIANATVTMVGQDEFGDPHTYTFTTNADGFYTGHVYAGSYDGSAACNGYQDIDEPVQGNPIAITYNNTTSPIDYKLDENFYGPCSVVAEYYPDSLDPESPYVKVYWGCGLPGENIIEDFETGDFSMFDWQLHGTYPWSITTTNPYEGTYCMKSGGAGVANVVSDMSVAVEIPNDGVMSFFGKISCENNWDYGYFYIDGVQKGQYTGAGSWTERSFDITAGTHTFKWSYTKDGSVNSNDDCFYVDYINFYKQPEPALPGTTYDFENSTMQGWTSLDADGDGYGWYVASEIMTTGYGHDGSNDCVLSQSYSHDYGILYPDNYLVSPQVPLGGLIRFYACAQDASYAAEHFGVAVSTTTNNNASAFTMLQEWTMTAKSGDGGKPVERNTRSGRAQGAWYEYTVDLSAYAGQTGYVAIRHFNCHDMFYLDVDDITITEPGKGLPNNDRAFSHYRVYRTNCYNDGPYTEENTLVLACELHDTVYIDTYWADPEVTPPGVYKWGVGCVYVGNRGEEVESPIAWSEPVVVAPEMANRDQVFDFENGQIPAGWTNSASYPWAVVDGNGGKCIKSSNGGVTSSTSSIETTVDFAEAGSVSFDALCEGEGTSTFWDHCDFAIDGAVMLTAGANISGWNHYSYPVSAGSHNFKWSYTKDSSVNPTGDAFSVDNVAFTAGSGSGGGSGSGSGTYGPGTDPIQEPRESVIVWSNCLDKDMYLSDVDINVLLNSADSPEGVTVNMTNLNEVEQGMYAVAPVVLDSTGFYAWDTFRKGEYAVKIEFEGYETINDTVSIWDATHLRYVMTEILYGVENVYVSRTGWAMWDDSHNNTGGGGTGGGGGGGGTGATTFTEGFEGSLNGWTVIDVNAGEGTWLHSSGNLGGYDYTTHAHGGTGFAMCYSFVDYVGSYDTDSYLVTPQKYDIVSGSTLTFWADNANDSYPESFSVCVSTADTPSASSFTSVWSGSAKGGSSAKANVRHMNDRYDNWRSHSVDLSAYAGQSVWIAFHDVNEDMYEVWIDDVALTAGAKSDERHLEYYKVMCTSIDGVPIFNHNTVHPFCQLSTDEPYNAPLVEGERYLCKVACMYSTGLGAWSEPVEWVYEPCDHWGPVDDVAVTTNSQGNRIQWTFDHGFNPYDPGAGGEGFAAPTLMPSGMLSNGTYALNITDVANFDERVYFLYNLMNDARFEVVNGETAGMFIVSAAVGYEEIDLEDAIHNFSYNNSIEFGLMDKVQAADVANAYKSAMPASFTNSLMMDLYIQSRENNMCAFADPFCTDNGMYEFPAGVNAGSGESGPDYDCLYTQPNPAWYYMRIGDPGAMDIHMYSTPEVDIDFCCWGPFDDPTTPCPYGLTDDKVVSCSYSTSWTEHCMIPATAQTGEYYILVITNYSNQTCNINFSAVGGTGSTDCGILPPVDIIGFLITQDGEYLAFAGPTDREYTDIDEFGDHEYCVRPIYPGEQVLPDHNYGWSMGCPVCNHPGGGFTCDPGEPIHAEELHATDQVKIWWGEAPAAPISEWLYYDDGVYGTSVGAGGTLYWGTMFPAASLNAYAGTSLTKVAIHTSYACSATLNVYVGGAQPGGSPAATQTFTMAGDQEFMEVTLNNPVAIDGTQNLWITFYQSGETYPADACADTGDANNRWVSIDGASWMDLSTAGLPGYGWMIRGFVTNQAKGGEVVALPEFRGNVGGELSHTEVVSKPADLSFMNRADILSYNVYRSSDNVNYVVVANVPYVEGQTYYEYIDTPDAAGTYYYQVTAVYDGCESDPAPAFDDPTVNYVTGTVDGIGENSDNVALYPNPTSGNVTIEANGMSRITVMSVLGQVVYDTEVNADNYTLNMAQFNAGMYLVRVYTENGVTVKRVTVMQ